jgi:hypothetical protein
MASGGQPLRCEAQSGIFSDNFFQNRPICNVHFAEQVEVGDRGGSGVIFEEPVNGLLQALFLRLRRECVKQSAAIMRNAEAVEKTAYQLLVGSKQPCLKHLGCCVIIGFPGQFSAHPTMAFGEDFSFQNDGTQFSARGEHPQASTVGGLVVLVEIQKNFTRSLIGESLEDFMGFHCRLPGSLDNPSGKTDKSQARREFDTRRQSRLYPAQ